MKSAGYWDINKDRRCLADVRIVDCGDVDIVYYDQPKNFANMTDAVRRLLRQGCLPVIAGGDHSVTFPTVCAFEDFSPLGIVHFDAHLDWIDEVDGVRFANGGPQSCLLSVTCPIWGSVVSAHGKTTIVPRSKEAT